MLERDMTISRAKTWTQQDANIPHNQNFLLLLLRMFWLPNITHNLFDTFLCHSIFNCFNYLGVDFIKFETARIWFLEKFKPKWKLNEYMTNFNWCIVISNKWSLSAYEKCQEWRIRRPICRSFMELDSCFNKNK